jgi:hypothetical protein
MIDVKTGARHLASLRDGRAVYIDGERIADVTTHPAFRNACGAAAALFDYQARSENLERMTFERVAAGESGYRRVNRAWQMPRSYDELVARRRAMSEWAESSCGFLGRAPDHVASSLLGQVIGIDVFRRHGEARAKALLDYFDYVSGHDLYLSYVIINPQANRGKAWGEQQPDLVARLVDEDSAGITVRGAKMLGTATILANELLVANLQPLRPGEEDLAISFAVPVATPGLKILSRKSFEAAAVSRADNPLSSRFDENDALIWFEDVKVPWERVFVYRDTDMCRAQFHDTLGHTFQNYQAQIRLMAKTKFLVGVARRLAETIGTADMGACARGAGAAGGAGGDGRGHGVGHGGQGAHRGRLFRARQASDVRRPGTDAGALSAARRDDPRPLRRRPDHAAVLRTRLGQSRAGRNHREDAGFGRGHTAPAGRFPEAGVGRDRLGIRLPPHPIRDVLRRRPLRDLRPFAKDLRLAGFFGAGR